MQPRRSIAWLTMLFLFLGAGVSRAQIKFIPNKGQWKEPSLYRADISSGRLFLMGNELRYSLTDRERLHWLHHHTPETDTFFRGHAVFIRLVGAAAHPKVAEAQASYEKYNYFLSHTASGWRTGLNAYSQLTYKNIYPGIDMQLQAEDLSIKYTYYVKAGADAAKLKLQVQGADNISVGKDQVLYIGTSLGPIVEKAPYAYQVIKENQVPVRCYYHLEGDVVSFSFPDGYDKSYPLVIDPTVIFATYSGSLADNFGFTGTYDSAGHGYSGGTVYDVGFPVTPGAFQTKWKGGKLVNGSIGDFGRDVGILKYSADGTKLLWATYLGGTHNEQPHSMVVDNEDHLIVFGTTYSADFPITKNAYDTSYNGNVDIYVSKFSTDGSELLASTFVGGSSYDGLNGTILKGVRNSSPLGYNYGDQFRGEVIIDSSNEIYVASTTYSSDFPVSAGALQTKQAGLTDGCVFKLSSDMSKLIWSTYVGASKYDACYSVQVDKKHNVFVCGGTQGGNLFNDGSTYQNSFQGDIADGFVMHISNDGKSLIDGTYVGTDKYDQTYFVQLDENENVYVYGQTKSTSYPVKNVHYSNPKSCQFITKFNNSLDNVIFSTVFGSGRSHPDISPTAFLVDNCQKIYISGWGGIVNQYPLGNGGNTDGMPITKDAHQSTTDTSDFYVAVFARDMDTLLYGSFFGGPDIDEHVDGGTSRFDKRGVIYQSVCDGCGGLSDFPATPGAYSTVNRSSNCNNLLFKVDLVTPDIKADFDVHPSGCSPLTIQPVNKSLLAKTFTWDFGDGTTSTDRNPTHTYTIAGNYTVRLIAHNPYSCKVDDTMSKTVQAYFQAKASFTYKRDTCSKKVDFSFNGLANGWHWDFGDGKQDTGRNISHTYDSSGTYKVKLTADPGTPCSDTLTRIVHFVLPVASFTYHFDTCKPVIYLTNTSRHASGYLWQFGTADTSHARNPSFNLTTPGPMRVRLTVTDSSGCQDTISESISIASRPTAGYTYSVDSCTGKVTFTNTSTNGNNYLWLFGDSTQSTTKNPVHTYPADSAVYNVRLVLNPGVSCADTLTKQVIVPRHPQALFAIIKDSCTQAIIIKNFSYKAHTFSYSFGDSSHSNIAEPGHIYAKKGRYTIQLIINTGTPCADTFSASVSIKRDQNEEVIVPNVITPNGDGKNDELVLQNLLDCKIYDMKVYNRWGQLVFHYTGNAVRWNGKTESGNNLPEGTYYYVFTNYDNTQQHGTLTILK